MTNFASQYEKVNAFDEKNQVLVVGAGIAGLTSAAILKTRIFGNLN